MRQHRSETALWTKSCCRCGPRGSNWGSGGSTYGLGRAARGSQIVPSCLSLLGRFAIKCREASSDAHTGQPCGSIASNRSSRSTTIALCSGWRYMLLQIWTQVLRSLSYFIHQSINRHVSRSLSLSSFLLGIIIELG